MRKRVAELATLMDRAGRLRRDVTRDAARERELAKQLAQSDLVVSDVRIDLAVGPFEERVRDEARAAVPRAGDVDRIQVACADRTVHMRVDEVEARGRSEMPKQPGLHVLGPQRLSQERVVEEVDLPNGEVVGCAPPGVDRLQL